MPAGREHGVAAFQAGKDERGPIRTVLIGSRKVVAAQPEFLAEVARSGARSEPTVAASTQHPTEIGWTAKTAAH